MFNDRPYAHSSFRRQSDTPVLKGLLISIFAIFVIQNVLNTWFGLPIIENLFSLSETNLRYGFVWTLATYSFLHGDLFHLLINMLIIFFIGKGLEETIGSRRFGYAYLTAVVAGGALWLLTNMIGAHAPILIGASAGALGILILYCTLDPEDSITFLFMFVIPITMQRKWLAYGLVGFELVSFLLYESSGQSSIAYSAHLGGMGAGYLWGRKIRDGYFLWQGKAPKITPPKWLQRKNKQKLSKSMHDFKINITQNKNLQGEVDRILDKINDQGFGALSAEERKILDKARDLLKH